MKKKIDILAQSCLELFHSFLMQLPLCITACRVKISQGISGIGCSRSAHCNHLRKLLEVGEGSTDKRGQAKHPSLKEFRFGST